MKHSARDLLQEEMAKLSRWQVALVDKSGAVYKKMSALEKEGEKVMKVYATVETAGEFLFDAWENLNAAMADGKEANEGDLRKIQTYIHIVAGIGEGDPEKPLSAPGVNSKLENGQLIGRELDSWANFKDLVNDDSFNGAFIKQLDIHKLPNWLEDLYDIIIEGDYDNHITMVRHTIEEVAGGVKKFEDSSKKFFDTVPEGDASIVKKGDKKSEHDFARRLLGVGGGENEPVRKLQQLRNDSRKAIQETMQFQRSLLKMMQVALSAMNETADLANHFTTVLHKTALAAANDLKAANQEVPEDLQEAIKALSPKALKG